MRIARAVIAGGLVACTMTTPGNASDAMATDFVLPHWQGTKTSPAAPGHVVDCRISAVNERADSHICDVSIATVTSSAKCYLEEPSDSVSGANPAPRRNTPCTATIIGGATWVAGPHGCTLEPSLRLSFSSGVNSTLYSFQDIPVGGAFVPLLRIGSYADYALDVYSIGATTLVHTPEIRERFLVRFNTAMPADCPSRDAPGLIANVYDPAPDLVVAEDEASAGYLIDNVCPGCNLTGAAR
jgi:hypothetical protein